jgi:hypothetical protein
MSIYRHSSLVKTVLQSRIIFMRLWLWAKILVRLRLLPYYIASSVADPGSGAFLPQESGMIFFPDPGSLPRPKFKILPLKIAKNRKN